MLNLDSSAKTIIAVTPQAPRDRVVQLQRRAEVLTIPEYNGRVDLRVLMERLGVMEIVSVLLEGGAEVNASALKMGIVDKIMVFIAPRLIGGREAPGPIGGTGIENLPESVLLEDISVTRIGEDILVTGIPKGED